MKIGRAPAFQPTEGKFRLVCSVVFNGKDSRFTQNALMCATIVVPIHGYVEVK